ncbi:MAG: glycosyltransferase family 4 protein [Sphingobacteriaceae bacterium]|nr:glycosyltransferase family 4 protein [Sphingobacteriaceae bacterium]
MKTVLILTYYWPPSGGAGVQRWLKFVKYLREFGWEPVVYTVENGELPEIDASLEKDIPKGVTIIKTPIWEPYNAYKKLIGQKKDQKINAAFLNENKKTSSLNNFAVWIRGNFFIPDARKFWVKPSIKYLNNYLQKNKVDVIISSGPPHSMHLIAKALKQDHPNIKWIADFRDPWTNIDFYKDLKLTSWAYKKHKRLEKEVLLESDAVISVGQLMSDELAAIIGTQNTKFKVITNGYDEDDLVKTQIEKDKKFSIAHIGTLVKTRNPKVLWKVLSELVNENEAFKNALEIKLVGKLDIAVKESIEEHKLSPFVNKIDYMPHDKVIEEQQRSRVNLLLVNQTPNAKSILTGKFFEYLSAGAPVLAIGPINGDVAFILKETKAGMISDFNDHTNLKKNVLELFHSQSITRNEDTIKKYSRKNLTKKLSEILNELTNN